MSLPNMNQLLKMMSPKERRWCSAFNKKRSGPIPNRINRLRKTLISEGKR